MAGSFSQSYMKSGEGAMPPWFKAIQCWKSGEPQPNSEGETNSKSAWSTSNFITTFQPTATLSVIQAGATYATENGYYYATYGDLLICEKPDYKGSCEAYMSNGECSKCSSARSYSRGSDADNLVTQKTSSRLKSGRFHFAARIQ